jgi:two-component system, LytTR family, response regulator
MNLGPRSGAPLLRCLIADDEAPARLRLRHLLGQMQGVVVAGEADSGVRALEQVTALEPDLLLLDIQMPELDGLGVAGALGAVPNAPALIFVTAYDEHALAAFELAALDYLVKPVSLARLGASLARVQRLRVGAPPLGAASLAALEPLRREAPRRLAVRSGARFIVFDPARVLALVSKDHYTAILLESDELLADEPLEQLGQRFDPQQFVRIHRGAIVNLGALRELLHVGDRKYVAVLNDRDATRVPISRERLGALKAALGVG